MPALKNTSNMYCSSKKILETCTLLFQNIVKDNTNDHASMTAQRELLFVEKSANVPQSYFTYVENDVFHLKFLERNQGAQQNTLRSILERVSQLQTTSFNKNETSEWKTFLQQVLSFCTQKGYVQLAISFLQVYARFITSKDAKPYIISVLKDIVKGFAQITIVTGQDQKPNVLHLMQSIKQNAFGNLQKVLSMQTLVNLYNQTPFQVQSAYISIESAQKVPNVFHFTTITQNDIAW